MLRKMPEWVKAIVCLDLLFNIAWYVVATVLGMLVLIVVIVRGDTEQILPLLETVVGALAILGFFYWISRDARKVGRELRRQRKTSRRPPAGDLRNAAGTPQQPPWMG